MNMGNVYRIRKAIEKTRAGKEVTLAYIGGSIPQGAGAAPINTECYAYNSYQLFQNNENHLRAEITMEAGRPVFVVTTHIKGTDKKIAVADIMAVSYTHLDVYKRQDL